MTGDRAAAREGAQERCDLTLLELLLGAVDHEIRSQDYFTRLVQGTSDPGVRRELLRVLRDEAVHERRLRELVRARYGRVGGL